MDLIGYVDSVTKAVIKIDSGRKGFAISEILPEKNLKALKPLLSVLSEPLYTIEPASSEESKKIEQRIKDYENDPSSFVPFKKRH